MKTDIKKTGAELIAEERQRQVTAEGWTAEHDDTHAKGELAGAGACYALQACGFIEPQAIFADRHGVTHKVQLWPFASAWWKPSADPRGIRDLVKAGALIAAEIDRRQRLKKTPFGMAPSPVWMLIKDDWGNDVWRANSPYHDDGDPMVYELSQRIVGNKIEWYYTGSGEFDSLFDMDRKPRRWDDIREAKSACAVEYRESLEVERIKAKPLKKKPKKTALELEWEAARGKGKAHCNHFAGDGKRRCMRPEGHEGEHLYK